MSKTRKQRGGSNNNENASLENVLGITAAVGYNKNVLGKGSALSTRSRSNYLTNTLRKKKLRNMFKGVKPVNWLYYAVNKQDAYLVKRLLEDPPKEFQAIIKDPAVFLQKRYEGQTLIEKLLNENLYKLNTPWENKSILPILLLLLKHGAIIEDNMITRLLFIVSLPTLDKIFEANPLALGTLESILANLRKLISSQNRSVKELRSRYAWGNGDLSYLRDAEEKLESLFQLFKVFKARLEKKEPGRLIPHVNMYDLNNQYNNDNNFNNNNNNTNYGNTMRQMYGNNNNANNNNNGNNNNNAFARDLLRNEHLDRYRYQINY
jgi:hypothetical protein